MLSKNSLQQFREFRSLKKNKHKLTKEQYIKELEIRLENIKADIAAPNLTDVENKTLFRLLEHKKSI